MWLFEQVVQRFVPQNRQVPITLAPAMNDEGPF
jgi:hypothetical protein